jgi:hypothetical protein
MIIKRLLPNLESSEQTIKSSFLAKERRDPKSLFSGDFVPLIVSSIRCSTTNPFFVQNRSISNR